MRRVSSVDVGAEWHGMDTLDFVEVNVIVRVPYGSYDSAIVGGAVYVYVCFSRVCSRSRQGEGMVSKGRVTTRK